MWMTEEMKKREELVLVGLRRFHGGGGQWWLWRKIPFVSLMSRPLEVVSTDFNQWVLNRIEKDEDWAFFEAIWLRNEEDMRI